MRLFERAKDGGLESPVDGYFLIEIKNLFSVVLLHFNQGVREAYHSHAFNAVTIWLKGTVKEHIKDYGYTWWYAGSIKFTPRNLMHKIEAPKGAWAISFRGPWQATWKENKDGQEITLTYGRKIVR